MNNPSTTTVRVLITRPELQAAGIAHQLRAIDATPVFLPCTEIRPIGMSEKNRENLRTAILNNEWQWVFFTSANAVTVCAALLQENALFEHVHLHCRIACINQKTAQAVRNTGLAVDYDAQARNAVDFAEKFTRQFGAGHVIIHPTSEQASEDLATTLRAARHTVTRRTIYRSQPCVTPAGIRQVLQNGLRVLTFFSPSAVHGFWQHLPVALQQPVRALPVVAIGETTAQALQKYDCAEIHIAAEPNEEAVAAIVETMLRQQYRQSQ